MELDVIEQNGMVVMILAGKMDANTVARFNRSFTSRVEGGGKLFIVDLSGLTYISSAGLRGVLTAVKKCEAVGGKLFLNGLAGIVHDAFQLSGFLRYFETFATREEAIAAAADFSG
jgi:anti-anti-sigma factor